MVSDNVKSYDTITSNRNMVKIDYENAKRNLSEIGILQEEIKPLMSGINSGLL